MMPLADYTAGLVTGTDSAASAIAILPPGAAGGHVNATAMSQATLPAVGQQPIATAGVPVAHSAGWYRIVAGGVEMFGIVLDARKGVVFTPYFALNVLPQPFGFFPPSWYALPDNYITAFASGGEAPNLIHTWLEEERAYASGLGGGVGAGYFGLPIFISDRDLAGLIVERLDMALIDP